MEFQNTNLKVIVASATSDAAETTLATFRASGSDGEVIATEQDGTVVAAGTTKFIVAALKGTDLDQSEVMDLSNVKIINAKAYAAPTHRSEAIGYNGTSGAIEVLNSNLYQINIELLNYGSLSPENRYFRQAHYMSKTSGNTQAEIADGLTLSLLRNFSREQVRRVAVTRLCNDAGDALGTGVDNVVFTKGSKVISATNIDDATTNAALAAGDYLRIGTATTSPVYKIVSIDTVANTAILDVPYQGVSETIADTGLERIPVADQAAASFGVVITGVDQPFVVGKLRFEPVDWRPITLVDFGTTETTLLSSPSKGIGDGRRVAELEWFANGNFGEVHRMGEPDLFEYYDQLAAVASGKYDVLVIGYVHKQTSGSNLVDTTSPRTLMVFCNAGSGGTTHTNINGLITDLNKSNLFSLATL